MKNRNLFSAALVLTVLLFADTTITGAPSDINIWLRLTTGYHINNKWTTDLEVQHRRQQTYRNRNPLQYPLLWSVRPWVYYKYIDNIRADFSPLAYYSSNAIANSDLNIAKKPKEEFRISMGMTTLYNVGTKFQSDNRLLLEYRNFTGASNTIRARLKLGLDYMLSNSEKIKFQEETLLNISGTTVSAFDQERIAISYQKQFNNVLQLELGYMFLLRETSSDAETMFREHNICLSASLHLKHRKMPHS